MGGFNLQNVQVAASENEKTGSDATSKRSFLLGPILIVLVFAFANNALVLEQYVYYHMQKTMFPNTTITPGEQTLCNSNSNTTNATSQNERDQQQIQVATSNFMLYSTLAFEIPCLFADLALGSLSDRFGRKRLLILPLTATFIKSVLCVIGIHFEINVYVLLIFYFIEGCAGSWVAALSVAFAFVADVTEPGKTRTFVIALIEICLGLGAAAGGISSGYMIKALSFMYPMLVSASLLLVGIVLVTCLPGTARSGQSPRNKPSRVQAIKGVLKLYIKDTSQTQRWKYIFCVLIFLFHGFSSLSRQKIETLYLLNSPFCWSSVKLGIYIVLRAVGPQVFGMLTVKPFQFCLNDASIGLIGALSAAAGNIFEGLATTNIRIYLVPVVASLGSLTVPMVRSILSHMTSPDMQGALFSSLAVIETLSSLIGSLVGTSVYSATVSLYTGFIFFIFGSCGLVEIILLSVLVVRGRKKSSVKNEPNEHACITKL